MNREVITGIDVLQREGFAALAGRQVGLITNHTGLNREGASTIDLLHGMANTDLRVLFGPEHGIRGLLDESVPDARDDKTGLPVYSLYGARTHPTDEQLTGLDTLIYDIQDVGARFYTFISTLGLCLEAAARKGLRFIVLDRPNPIGGVHIDGPIADHESLSFVAYHTLPVRHGLTVGELARLFNAEKKLGADLHVVPLDGWRRADLWYATGLTWTNPSPNMRSLTQALLYPGLCLLEYTNVSVGRGTDTPFEVIGAPWLDGRRLAAALNERNLPGIQFIPIRFKPTSSVHVGAVCGGINNVLVDWSRFQPVRTGLAIAETLLRLYPKEWETARFDRLLANKATLAAFRAGATAEEMERGWQADLKAFDARRKPYLLYK